MPFLKPRQTADIISKFLKLIDDLDNHSASQSAKADYHIASAIDAKARAVSFQDDAAQAKKLRDNLSALFAS